MLHIKDEGWTRNCGGIGRREFLRVGTLALGGLTLADLLALRAHAAELGVSTQDKAVVLLFLQGGPSHIEFFDPKMDAPSEVRSTTGEVRTTIPGLTFGGTFPKMAKMADRLAIVRSYASLNGGHTYQDVLSARNPLKATIGTLCSRISGSHRGDSGMPSTSLVLPEAIQSDIQLRRNFETGALPGLTSAGSLGSAFEPFNPAGGGAFKENLEIRIPRARFDDRKELLSKLDRLRRQVDRRGALEGSDRYQRQAFDMITRGIADAFDISKEDPRTVAKYDTSHIFDMAKLNRFNDMFRATNLLGKQMLMARRLVEAGCGFVTVADAGWDMHGNSNSLPGLTGIVPMGHQVDHAVSTFLEDIEQRGLRDKVLLIITGEMGRSPKINRGAGRDHYGNMTSLAFAGGGLNMGQVIGQSDSMAGRAVSRQYEPKNLLATVMHWLFDIGKLRLRLDLPADVLNITTSHDPIAELF